MERVCVTVCYGDVNKYKHQAGICYVIVQQMQIEMHKRKITLRQGQREFRDIRHYATNYHNYWCDMMTYTVTIRLPSELLSLRL